MIVPLRSGNGNRADLQGIVQSLLNQRGDAITKDVGSAVWIEVNAQARAIYNIWANNTKMFYQLDPNRLSDFISRWEVIMGVSPLPTDTLQNRRDRIVAKFAIVGKMPTTQVVRDLLAQYLGSVFLVLLNTTADEAIAQFPNPPDIMIDGKRIDGAVNTINPGTWLSTVQNIFVEVKNQPYMLNNQFYQIVNQIFPLLGSYLPAYTKFDWFWSSFNDSGNTTAGAAVISVSSGSTALTGSGTAWNTPLGFSGRLNLSEGSILEAYDDNGEWQRLVVQSVDSDTGITLQSPAISNITSQQYVIQGFFADCRSDWFPYPPSGCLNADNAGVNNDV